jgi:HAD superfamily hydrolase (TIGR01509 family)
MLLPSAVLFDLFATLAVEDFGPLVAIESAWLGVTAEEFSVANDTTRHARSRLPDGVAGTRLILDRLDLDPALAPQLLTLQQEWLVANGKLYDDSLATLEKWRAIGVKTAVVCNGSAFVRPWLEVNGLSEAADVVLLSAEERVAKPEAEIFRRACAQVGVRPGPLVWFVDDQAAYLDGARALGIRCWRIARPGAVRSADDEYPAVEDLESMFLAARSGVAGESARPLNQTELIACRQRVLQNLSSVVDVLQRIESELWLEWMRLDALRIESGDPGGVTHLLSAFGGMGSFNDLVVDPRNGHPVTDLEAKRLDEQLCILRSFIWSDAIELRNANAAATPPMTRPTI